MSGSGKTTWAKRLAWAGFRAISCDDRIEKKLAVDLAGGGHRGIAGVAAWMGWPDQPAYHERAAKYLECEKQVMEELFAEIMGAREPIVVDTTGSVVHTGDTICQRLRDLTTVIYLETSANERDLLIARFLGSPKPVVWTKDFVRMTGESRREMVARCYTQLIERRERLYQKYAHYRIPIAALRDLSSGPQGFLQMIHAQAFPPR